MTARERAIPVLPADDLRVAREFYAALGFDVLFEASEDGVSGLLGVARGSIEITLDAPMSGHGRNACVSLRVNDADACYAEWRARGVAIARPPRDEPWGARTFGVTDPSGNTIFVIGPPTPGSAFARSGDAGHGAVGSRTARDPRGEPIRWRMNIPVTPDRVFDALDTPSGRASFWAESAEEVDGRIEFRFPGGETWSGRILARERPRLFALDYFGGPARFDLAPDDSGGTELALTHEGVAPGEWADVHAGWLNVLFPLKAWLVTGVDLRNHDPARTWRHGYADQ